MKTAKPRPVTQPAPKHRARKGMKQKPPTPFLTPHPLAKRSLQPPPGKKS